MAAEVPTLAAPGSPAAQICKYLVHVEEGRVGSDPCPAPTGDKNSWEKGTEELFMGLVAVPWLWCMPAAAALGAQDNLWDIHISRAFRTSSAHAESQNHPNIPNPSFALRLISSDNLSCTFQ